MVCVEWVPSWTYSFISVTRIVHFVGHVKSVNYEKYKIDQTSILQTEQITFVLLKQYTDGCSGFKNEFREKLLIFACRPFKTNFARPYVKTTSWSMFFSCGCWGGIRSVDACDFKTSIAVYCFSFFQEIEDCSIFIWFKFDDFCSAGLVVKLTLLTNSKAYCRGY